MYTINSLCKCSHTHMHIHTYTRMHIHTHAHTYTSHTYTSHTCTHMHIHAHIRTHMHTHTHTCTHIRTHTCTHIHTHTHHTHAHIRTHACTYAHHTVTRLGNSLQSLQALPLPTIRTKANPNLRTLHLKRRRIGRMTRGRTWRGREGGRRSTLLSQPSLQPPSHRDHTSLKPQARYATMTTSRWDGLAAGFELYLDVL